MQNETTSEEISLKWGTLKGWSGFQDNTKAMDLLERYHAIGASMSAAMQRDTVEQKQILCDLVRIPGMKIYLDWDGRYVTAEEAVDYISNYRKDAP